MEIQARAETHTGGIIETAGWGAGLTPLRLKTRPDLSQNLQVLFAAK